ncbi:MAG: hypothetical protein GY788_26055 [bacterium]|nr:hypothetical protein [bacterium]
MQRPEHELHVVDNEIHIDFNVPLPAEGADGVLADLLSHHALEILNDRINREHPLKGIPVLQVFAKRRGESVPVATLDLGEPEDVVEMEMPTLLPSGVSTGYDPLSKYGAGRDENVLELAEHRESDDLGTVGSQLRLTAGVAAGLRSMGIDPETMTVCELGRGLLDLAGYSLTDRGDGTWVASGKGTSTFVQCVSHVAGDYPELSHGAVAAFLVAFARARTERGMLITDKFGPYEIYMKERANPDCVFVTRERFQGFVDAIALS